ncbi:hypothetical protein TRFO_16150 [Tritrichomonas foetus]|uniref:Uncharacterized protein n=1 Tax=Tritrichomonas foetus TaxID=1144522 RepID=A0A1J4KW19_9EUKA|nr:hypothetical protein TRFO_16150 [Tritrichomonas foetus]|eukprot:OHT13701.1 hypothetical protein TRFO_16150 [Tritrichomonas foetus]
METLPSPQSTVNRIKENHKNFETIGSGITHDNLYPKKNNYLFQKDIYSDKDDKFEKKEESINNSDSTIDSIFFNINDDDQMNSIDIGNAFEEMQKKIPTYKYKHSKFITVPFDRRSSNDGNFDSLNEAMLFIAHHCMMHHSKFTVPLARNYLPLCRVLDFLADDYVTPTKVKQSAFLEAFRYAKRELPYAFY